MYRYRRARLAGALGFVLAMIVGCGPAEEPAEPDATQPAETERAEPAAPAAAATVTLTGCLGGAAQAPPGGEGSEFRLTVTEGTGQITAGARYALMPEAGVDLKPHVGHTVRVTGTELPGGADEPPTLMVQSMQHVAPTCEPPKPS